MRRRPALALLPLMLVASCTSPAPARGERLRQIDDLPLYELTYTGAYDALSGVDRAPATPFGCSLFVRGGLFARNFDWDANPALVLHTDPPDGYASISVVDMSYLDGQLDRAPLLPFDGMNVKGLAVGLAADESGRAGSALGKPTVGGVRILRLILDRAATVAQALAVLDEFNLDFAGGPALHYLVADAAGDSAVIEFVDGRTRVLRGEPVLTNIRLDGAGEQTRLADRRYGTAAQALPGVGDWQSAMRVLRAVAQPHTRWSVVYDLRTGRVHLTPGQRWDRVLTFEVGRS